MRGKVREREESGTIPRILAEVSSTGGEGGVVGVEFKRRQLTEVKGGGGGQ